jgi:hypothetical protein
VSSKDSTRQDAVDDPLLSCKQGLIAVVGSRAAPAS